MIEVVEYQPAWRGKFEKLKAAIWPRVSDFADRIEHVGSTSVEGLWAKPVIDLDIVVMNKDSMDGVINGLAQIGYTHRGNLGIEGREAFKNEKPEFKHNLYACVEDCLAFRNHILLRDHLMNNPDDRDKYSEIKRKLATKFSNDVDSYIDGKTDFILSILKQYELSTSDLSAIKAANIKDRLQIRERTNETLEQIVEFYRSVGYGGPVDENDKYFFAYLKEILIAVVRIAQENGEYVLRGMYMSEEERGKGIGKRMLASITPYLNSLNSPCYCIPYAHLEGFYSNFGFVKISGDDAPQFLVDRQKKYLEQGSEVILMGRTK